MMKTRFLRRTAWVRKWVLAIYLVTGGLFAGVKGVFLGIWYLAAFT